MHRAFSEIAERKCRSQIYASTTRIRHSKNATFICFFSRTRPSLSFLKSYRGNRNVEQSRARCAGDRNLRIECHRGRDQSDQAANRSGGKDSARALGYPYSSGNPKWNVKISSNCAAVRCSTGLAEITRRWTNVQTYGRSSCRYGDYEGEIGCPMYTPPQRALTLVTGNQRIGISEFSYALRTECASATGASSVCARLCAAHRRSRRSFLDPVCSCPA